MQDIVKGKIKNKYINTLYRNMKIKKKKMVVNIAFKEFKII